MAQKAQDQRGRNALLDLCITAGAVQAVDDHVEVAVAVKEGDVVGIAVGAAVFDTEGEHRMCQALDGLAGALVIGVGDDKAALRHQGGKVMEGVLDIGQVLEEVQMIFVNIQDYADLREEMQETVRIFTGFCDKIFRITYTDVTADSL